MLVLTRKKHETIAIYFAGEWITITVQQLRSNRVSLGVVAPKDARIIRGELAEHDTTDRTP